MLAIPATRKLAARRRARCRKTSVVRSSFLETGVAQIALCNRSRDRNDERHMGSEPERVGRSQHDFTAYAAGDSMALPSDCMLSLP
jgi:hypothetical protein